MSDLNYRIAKGTPCRRDISLSAHVVGFSVNVVQWNEDCYERTLIERTKDSLDGEVDIVIDFGTTSRSLHRSLQCLSKVRNILELQIDCAKAIITVQILFVNTSGRNRSH